MKVSLLIPVYNASATIKLTLDSVLSQTLPPDEILIMNDGSTDDTYSILHSYGSLITLMQQQNAGVASTRNRLCGRASGDLIAFLDQDDIWHPTYLETQRKQYEAYPRCAGFFTAHVNFHGYGLYDWTQNDLAMPRNTVLIPPSRFLRMLDSVSGSFVSPSFFCLPRWVLTQMDSIPFCEKVCGVDDHHLYGLLALLGPVAYCTKPLGAYRIIDGSLSTNKVKGCDLAVESYRLLTERYEKLAEPRMLKVVRSGYASTRRQYAKRLMGAGRVPEARQQFRLSLGDSGQSESVLKSLGMLFFTYMPSPLQPKWPPQYREVVDDARQKA